MSLLLAINSCSYSYPLQQNCEKRVSNSLSQSAMNWDKVHTQLLFDFSTTDTQKTARILKNGYAESGPPGLITAMGNNKAVHTDSKTGAPVITEHGNEILVDGPSGAIKDVITKACALETQGVWLKSVNMRPFNTTDTAISEVAK